MSPAPSPTPDPNVDPGQSGDEQKDPQLEALKSPILKLISDDVRNAIDPEKIWQYADIRKNELYWRGNQYLDEIYAGDGTLVDYRPINGTWHQENPDADDSALYDTVINDVRGYGRKFIAVLAQQPPNVKAVPNDEDNEIHVRRARKAQRIAQKLHGLWDIKKQNRQLYLTYYKSGTAFGYTPFVANGEKYGYIEEPQIEMVPQQGESTANCVQCGTQTPVDPTEPPPTTCPGCGAPLGPEDIMEAPQEMAPQQTGTNRYANGCVEHRVESGLRVTTPFDIMELTDAPWLLYEYEEHKGKLFSLFPKLRDKYMSADAASYGDAGSSTTSGQLTRDLASSPSGTYIAPRKNRLLFSQCWLRPVMYELIRSKISIALDPAAGPQMVEGREAMIKLYPKGCKVTLVNGDQIVKLEDERMDDVWTISPPEPAENAYPDPLCKDFMDVQDQTNDFANISRQTWERAIPQVFIDTRRIDTTFQSKYRQLPGTFIPVQGGPGGGNLNDAIGKVPNATPEPEMDVYGDKVREHGAEIIGITPPIFGGGAAEQTAYATNLKRNQAMLQLSTPADAGRTYWANVTYNAVMSMAKLSNGSIPSRYASETEPEPAEDLSELLQGGWHFESADSMPMSWSERREQLNETLKNNAGNPQILHMLGFDMPANVPELQQELIGMPDWDVPNQDSYNKIQDCIRQLLQGQPVTQPSQTGEGEIQVPSVPVDEWDDHAFFAQALADWLNSRKGMDARTANPPGFSNVEAFWKSHAGLAMPPPMPGGPPGAGGPPGPGGPPPDEGAGPKPPAGSEATAPAPSQ